MKIFFSLLDHDGYLGCFIDRSTRDLKGLAYDKETSLTVEKCIDECADRVRSLFTFVYTEIVLSIFLE